MNDYIIKYYLLIIVLFNANMLSMAKKDKHLRMPDSNLLMSKS